MILADTGFWVALLDRRDNLHTRVRAKATQLTEPLITTVPVVTEVCYLLPFPPETGQAKSGWNPDGNRENRLF